MCTKYTCIYIYCETGLDLYYLLDFFQICFLSKKQIERYDHKSLTSQIHRFEQIEFPTKLLDYFLWSNKSIINQPHMNVAHTYADELRRAYNDTHTHADTNIKIVQDAGNKMWRGRKFHTLVLRVKQSSLVFQKVAPCRALQSCIKQP